MVSEQISEPAFYGAATLPRCPCERLREIHGTTPFFLRHRLEAHSQTLTLGVQRDVYPSLLLGPITALQDGGISYVESIWGRKEKKDKRLKMQRNSLYINYPVKIPRQSWVHLSLSLQPPPARAVTAASPSTSSHRSKGRGWSGYPNMPSHTPRRICSTCSTACTPWVVALVWMAQITCTDTLAVWQSG